jgi:FtsH-binding integral membrane protein
MSGPTPTQQSAQIAAYPVLDFNRLRRAGEESAVPIAASIFLDVTNVFLFLLQLFGGRD